MKIFTKNSQKGFIVPLVAVIVLLVLAGGVYVAVKKNKVPKTEDLPTATSTPKITQPVITQLPSVPQPVITSLFPSTTVAEGATIEIQGKNLAGLDGALVAFLKRADGKIVKINSLVPYYSSQVGSMANTTLVKVKLESPCLKGQKVYDSYSAVPTTCDYFEFTPGDYEVYVQPWGMKSNAMKLTITN